jgi:LmbE family N-acetylglucosaminyl deacetylase
MIPLQIGAPHGPLRHVVAIGAHSDDVEIGCGGLMLALAELHPDLEFTWVVMTGGPERAAEAAASADSFFPDGRRPRLITGGLRDGFLPYDAAAGKDLLREAVAGLDLDLILNHHHDDLHQDHRFLAELGLQLFRDDLILEYEIPKYDADLGRPNLYAQLTSAQVDAKVRHLMRYFASQRSKRWFTEDLFRGLMRVRGVEAAAESGFAEGFHVRKAVLG